MPLPASHSPPHSPPLSTPTAPTASEGWRRGSGGGGWGWPLVCALVCGMWWTEEGNVVNRMHLPCVGRKEPSSWQRCKASGMGGGWRAAEAAVLVAVKAVVSGEWGGGRRRGSPTQFHDTQQGSMAEPWAAAAMVAVNWAAWQSLDGAAVVVVKAVGNDRGGRRAGGRRGRLTHGEEGSLSQQKP
ncbi:unnamed protein product [Closterium sp. NIES-65]|nr:unnamed protein product [Closterium sp. NIES-65]